MPAFHLVVTLALELGVGIFAGRDAGPQALKVLVSAFDVRVDPRGDEGSGQFAQIEHGSVEFFALTRLEDALDGADLTQPAQTLERAAAAGAEARYDLVEAERSLRREKQSVNLPDRRREREGGRGALENRHALALEIIELRLGIRRLAEIVFGFDRHAAGRCRTW